MALMTLAQAQAATLRNLTRVTRRVDIYEADGVTPWLLDAPVTKGNISVDQTRSERRTLDISFYNESGLFRSNPGGFWYDKVIVPYRGVRYKDDWWEAPLGQFVVDRISEQNFPNEVQVTCRDFTKKLLMSKFTQATTFTQGTALETVIRAIATNAGITSFLLPNSGKTLGRDYTFERLVDRWAAISELATAYNYEIFFNPTGTLVMQDFRDPFLTPPTHTFNTGKNGNLASYSKETSDSRIYNHIIVYSSDADTAIYAYADVKNTAPTSPTRVERLGDRVSEYSSGLITTAAQALDIANTRLKILALEQYELNMSAIVAPWLEAGEIVEFIDPDPDPGDPTRFLLSNFSIPLTLEAMSVNAKRVTYVG